MFIFFESSPYERGILFDKRRYVPRKEKRDGMGNKSHQKSLTRESASRNVHTCGTRKYVVEYLAGFQHTFTDFHL